jgi:hypothetical protein
MNTILTCYLGIILDIWCSSPNRVTVSRPRPLSQIHNKGQEAITGIIEEYDARCTSIRLAQV